MIATEHFENCNRTPALPLMARGWSELIASSLADPCTNICWDDEGLIARLDNVPCGVLSFQHVKWERSIWVKLGYVLPDYRRKGVYRALFARLTEIARERKVPVILGSTSMRNADMQGVMARLGREAFALQYRFEVGANDA